jgi:hypothetical protein
MSLGLVRSYGLVEWSPSSLEGTRIDPALRFQEPHHGGCSPSGKLPIGWKLGKEWFFYGLGVGMTHNLYLSS